MPLKLEPRIPIVEAIADAGQEAFLTSARELKPEEKRLLSDIFRDSLDLMPIQLARTDLGINGRAYTLGNVIRIPKGSRFTAATLVHEATHVWQYQTRGTGYISNSLVNQAISGAGAYDFELLEARRFVDYNAEQQATIVEKYYLDWPEGFNKNALVLRYIEEIRRARPLSAQQKQQDRWVGPGRSRYDDFRPPDDRNRPAATVPLIRIDFDFLK